MDLRTIVEMEDFIPIFIETTERYYSNVLGKEIEISQDRVSGAKCLYINFIPSFVASFPASKGMKETLYSEYNVRGGKIKYIAGKALVFFTLSARGMFSWKRLWVKFEDDIQEHIFCLPCNRTNRYFDFKNDFVDCVTKVGYGTGLMENQLNFRIQYQYSFVPKVIDRGEYWYRERIMHGNSLARVVDQKKYYSAKKEAVRCLGQLVNDTKEIYSAKAYTDLVKKQLECLLIEMGQEITENTKNTARQLVMSIKLDDSFRIPVCISHGDFQTGNIWVNIDGTVTIYDWETNGQRSIWYDLVTMQINLRNTIGTSLFRDFIFSSNEYLVYDTKTQYSNKERDNILRIIIIEDFLFQLVEYSQRLFDRSDEGLNRIIKKYQGFLGDIYEDIKE